jgi:hypothetical protein
MKKQYRVFAVLAVCLVTFAGWAALHGQSGAGSPNAVLGATYLTTITNASTGAFSSRSLITLHTDHSFAAVDSGQGGPGVQFSSQQGNWAQSPGATITARTLDFSFPPNAGIARVDYDITTVSADTLSGTITLTFFPLGGDPLGGGGTPGGTFNFTGTRVTLP